MDQPGELLHQIAGVLIQNHRMELRRYDLRIGQPVRQKGNTTEADGFDHRNAEIFLPGFNDLVEIKDITLFESKNISIIMVFLLVAALTGIISGSYPALFVSGFQWPRPRS